MTPEASPARVRRRFGSADASLYAVTVVVVEDVAEGAGLVAV